MDSGMERSSAREDDRLLRVPDVADRISASVSKTWQLVLSGSIPSVHVNRSRRVKSSDLSAWIRSLPPADTMRHEKAVPDRKSETAGEAGRAATQHSN
jgi:excisionase family DNA binding protein